MGSASKKRKEKKRKEEIKSFFMHIPQIVCCLQNLEFSIQTNL
jgi:hypothetical protein